MRGSLRIGSMAGIAIYIHWTFLFLVGWIIFSNWSEGARGILVASAFFAALFGCIVLHELGHALAARKFNVKTRDITILPIGGLARLERMPERPSQELWVAIAGPLVNVVIAAAIYVGLLVSGGHPTGPVGPANTILGAIQNVGFLPLLMQVNLFLVVFNLIPAFPMDGGRVLRAILAYRFSFATATRWAAGVGQVVAVLFAVWGLLGGNFALIFIAVFVFLGAQAEAQVAQVRGGLSGIPVRDAMVKNFMTLDPRDTLGRASEALLAGAQQDFPIVAGGAFVGILPRADLIKALSSLGPQAEVAQAMRRDCPVVGEYDMLYRVFQTMQETNCPIVPVLREGQVVGLVTLENVGELMMIRSALGQKPRPPRARTVPAT